MQLDEMVVTQVEQVRALQDSAFLGRFLEPASPSDVARSLGIPANLAHYRAKRHAAAGLLARVARERGKIYYQLVARTFVHSDALLPVGNPDEYTAATLKLLGKRFMAAYERSERVAAGLHPNLHVYSFDRARAPRIRSRENAESARSCPAHFQARTLSLTPERYRELVRQVARLLADIEADPQPEGRTCTVTFLAMEGCLHEGATNASHYVSSFEPTDSSGSSAAQGEVPVMEESS